MTTLYHTCDNCSSEFTIKYDQEQVEDDPHFCSFCGEFMIETDNLQDEDE